MTKQSPTARTRATLLARTAAALALSAAVLGPVFSSPAEARDGAVLAALPSFADLVERVSPAVVTITATGGAQDRVILRTIPPELRDFLERFDLPGPERRPLPRGERPRSLGSGFVIDPAGHIVTNRHVIDGATEVTVTFQDGSERKATIVGQDDKTDLAVLKVEADRPLTHLEFGDSDGVRVGDWVIAVGNPFGLGGTVTAGIVSARGRDIRTSIYDDFLQIDAPINGGNSGGPTFNAKGEVIGINTLILSPTGSSVGIGFAIPSNLAESVVKDLIADGKVDRGWLGVSLQALTPDLAEGLGLKEPSGALVNSVEPDSPAGRAGLAVGDVVLKAAGKPVEDSRALARIIGGQQPGAKVDLAVWRDGKERTLAVTLGSQPGEQVVAASANAPADAAPDTVEGLRLASLDAGWRQRLGMDADSAGVVVTAVEPEVEGLRPGDVIQQVNRKAVGTPAEVRQALDAARKDGRENALLYVRRSNGSAFIPLRLGKA